MPLIVARLGLALLGLVLIVPASYAAKIERIVSPGGVVAWLVEDNAVPVIAINFAFTGGAAQDPAGKPGVANMLSGLLDEGAGDLDSKAYQARLDDLALSLSFDSGRDDFFGSMKTLAENRDAAFDMLALALQSPRFDKEPVERIRAQIESGIKRSADDPEMVAMEAMCASAFPNHPYGQPVDGTEASVQAISADDLKTYRTRIFARDNLKVAIVGAIDPKEAGAMLDRAFGGLQAKAQLAPLPKVEPHAAVVNIDMPNPQTVIRFGGPGIPRHDPDFMAGYLVNHIIGGGTFSSRLYEEVREKRGLAYTISTTVVPLDSASAFAGGTATRSDRADETVGIIRAEIAKMAKDGPTEAELAKAKSYLIGSYALRFDSSTKIARQILGIQLDGLPIDYVEKRNEIIASITIDDARRAAKRLLADGTDLIVRVGPVTKAAEAARLEQASSVKHL